MEQMMLAPIFSRDKSEWRNWYGCLGTVGDYNSVPFVRDKVNLARLSGGQGSAEFRYIYLLCFLPARPLLHLGSLALF